MWVTLRAVVGTDAPFLALAVSYLTVAIILHRSLGVPADLDFHVSWRLLAAWTVLYSMAAILAWLVHAVVVEGASLFEARTWRKLAGWYAAPHKALSFALVFAVLPIFMMVFVAFKQAIPSLQPFSWDIRFMEWDQMVHFGVHPWLILQPLVGHPLVTRAIDFVYYLWFPVLWLTVIWQAWHGSRATHTRSQFLLAFAACWILLGTVAAALLSSAGPVYFGAVTGAADPYAPLLEYLHRVDSVRPLKALWVQDVLWQGYVDPAGPSIEGISAMPSMHVSMAVLLTLLGFRVHRRLGWAYASFALLIFVGSVHLGWHYAVDGYAAALLTSAVWWGAGWSVQAWRRPIGLRSGLSADR